MKALVAALLLLTAFRTSADPPGPGQPFDCTLAGTTSCASDDVGCVSGAKTDPSGVRGTLKCGDGTAKAFGKAIAAVIGCHKKQVDAAFKGAPIDDEPCEQGPTGRSAKEKLDAARLKLAAYCTAAQTSGADAEEALLFAGGGTVGSLDYLNGHIYCQGTSPVDGSGDDAGQIPDGPNAKETLACEHGVARELGKLASALLKCHVKMNDAFFVGKDYDEELCEETGPKSATARFDGAMAKLTPKCTDSCNSLANRNALRDYVKNLVDGGNALEYPCPTTTTTTTTTSTTTTTTTTTSSSTTTSTTSTTIIACGAFVTKWGNGGSADGELQNPVGAAVDASGAVYVADFSNDRVQKFDNDGTFLAKWGTSGSGDGQFSGPYAVAVDPGSGNVVVADSGHHRIQVFTNTGGFVTKWGSAGAADGQFNTPEGVAVDGTGNVFVADTSNARIQKFTSAGVFVGKWGSAGNGNGQFSAPVGIAVDGSGNVFVDDSSNNRIQKFDNAGTFLATWGSAGNGDGQFSSPQFLAVDASGNVFVSDFLHSRVQKFTNAGAFVTKWGVAGSGDGEFSVPEGIAVDGDDDVFVVEAGNSRVQKFACP